MEFKIIVAGSRNLNNYKFIKKKLDYIIHNLLSKNNYTISIVSGTCKGVDILGEQYAKEKNYKIYRFPAYWDKYGKKAGFERNLEMAKFADMAIVFNRLPSGTVGSNLMIKLAKEYNLLLEIVWWD